MAEQEKEETEAKEGQPEAEPKSKKKLFIIVGVVLLVVLAAVGMMVLGGGGEKAEEGEEESAEAEEKQELGSAELENFIVNLSTSSTYLRIKLLVEYDMKVLAAAGGHAAGESSEGGGGHGGGSGPAPLPGILGERNPMIRDAVITLLGSKNAENLLSPDGKEELKEELIDAINEAIGSEDPIVVNVYFMDLIIQ